jgi:hypothetical protein
MADEPRDRLIDRLAGPYGPLTITPQFRFPPGTGIRIHMPGFTGSRGYINDDGALVIVGAEREEDDEPRE